MSMHDQPQPQPQPLTVPAWVTGSLPEGFLHREMAPQEAVWAGRPTLGVSQSVRQPGTAQEELMALAPLRATLASVPRSRMIEYRLATMSAEEALREQAAIREAQSPSRWDGATALGYTRAHLPLRGGRESDPRWLAGTGTSGRCAPPGRPDAAPPSRSRPKSMNRKKTAEQVALGFSRPDEEPLQKKMVGGRTVVANSVLNHAQVLPEVRTDGSETAPSDPRPFTDTETEEEKRARVLRASSRTWLHTEISIGGEPVEMPAAAVWADQAVPTVSPGTVEQQERRLKAAQRQQQEVASHEAAVTRLLGLLGVIDTLEPKDPMNAACLFAQRVEANVERSFNQGTLYEGRRADKATLWRVLRDYLQVEEKVEVDHEGGNEGRISPVDLRRGLVQLGLVPTDDVFAQLIILCRQIADPEFDPVLSDQPIWLWEMRDMRVDIDNTISLEHLADAIRQLAALGEPGNRKVSHFPRTENAAVAAHLVWHDEEAETCTVCKTDSSSRRQSARHKQWHPVTIAVICLHLLFGLWESDGDAEVQEEADTVEFTTVSTLFLQVANLACVAVHATDCTMAARLAAAPTASTTLMTRVALTSLILVDEIAFFAVAVAAGRDAASHLFDTRALRPVLLLLHPGARMLRRELARVLSLLFATWELFVLLGIIVLGVLRSFALTQAPDMLVLAPGCPPTETNDVLLLFCGGYTVAMLVVWGLAIAATLTHCERLNHEAQFREAERREVVLSAAFSVLDLDSSGTISDQDFRRYALCMADEGNVSVSKSRVQHIWETIVPDSTSATREQFIELNSALLFEIAEHASLWCMAHAECTMPRVAEPCLERVKECDVLAPAIGGDLTDPFKPEAVIIKKFEHAWQPSRQSKTNDEQNRANLSTTTTNGHKRKTQHKWKTQPEKPQTAAAAAAAVESDDDEQQAQAGKRTKVNEPNKHKPKLKWQAAQEILDRGKMAASKADGVQRELFYLTLPHRVNPLLVWEPADAVKDPKTGKPAHPYRQVQNHGVAIARSLIFKNFSANEFSDPASRLLDVHCEYGPLGPTTVFGRLFVGGLWPKQLRKTVIVAWQWCLGECVVLLALLLPTIDGGDRSNIVVVKLLCCAMLATEAVVTVLAVGVVGYWRTSLHRRHALTTSCFVLSLIFELAASDRDNDGGMSDHPTLLVAVSVLAHMVAASRLLGFMRLLRPRRGENAATSTVWLVSTVVSRCSTALGLHVLLLVLLLYSSAAALHFDASDHLTIFGNSTLAGTASHSSSTMAARLVAEGVVVLGGEQGAIDLRSGSAMRVVWLLLLLWVTRVLLPCSAVGHVVVCWWLESQRYGHPASQSNQRGAAEFEKQNALITETHDSRVVLRALDDQMTPLRLRFSRGCRRWFRLLTNPHEWPIKEMIMEDRICSCCHMRQAICGPLHPVFMPLRRAKQWHRHHFLASDPAAHRSADYDDEDDVIPVADVIQFHAPMSQHQPARTQSVGSGDSSLTCGVATTGSSGAIAVQRRGFEPIWSCGACVAVYMARELMSLEKQQEEPSEEEIAKAKQQERQQEKVEKKEAKQQGTQQEMVEKKATVVVAGATRTSVTSCQRGQARSRKTDANTNSRTRLQHPQLEPELQAIRAPANGGELQVATQESANVQNKEDEPEPEEGQEHHMLPQQHTETIVEPTCKIGAKLQPNKSGRKLSE